MKILLSLTKSLFNIMLITLVIVTVVSWSAASPEKRQEILQRINDIAPFDIFKTGQNIKTSLNQTIKNIDNDTLNEGLSLLSNTINTNLGHFQTLDFNCGTVKPIDTKKELNTQKKIYQWTDEQGRTHFGDEQNHLSAKDISDKYRIRNKYISINIENINYSPTIGLNTTIELSIEKMFMVLSDSLSIAQLNELDLKLKIFGEKSEFDIYLNEKAPALSGFAAGFYLPNENEASVLFQRDSKSMLSLIRHESSHVMMANLYGQSPIWLNEGFAEYFSELKVSGLETTIYPNINALRLLRNKAKDGTLSIRKHISLKPREWQGGDVKLHYAEAWSIVYFLLSKETRKNVLKNYMNELSENRCVITNALAFFDKHYSGGLDVMNQEWHDWITQHEIHPHRY